MPEVVFLSFAALFPPQNHCQNAHTHYRCGGSGYAPPGEGCPGVLFRRQWLYILLNRIFIPGALVLIRTGAIIGAIAFFGACAVFYRLRPRCLAHKAAIARCNGKRRLSAASRFYRFIGFFPCYWALWSFFLFLEMPNTVRVPTPLMHRIASHKTELLSPVWGVAPLPVFVPTIPY